MSARTEFCFIISTLPATKTMDTEIYETAYPQLTS